MNKAPRLTDQTITNYWNKWAYKDLPEVKLNESIPEFVTAHDMMVALVEKQVAQTRQDTIREIKEWGGELCKERQHIIHRHLQLHWEDVPRRVCPECWQSLGEKK